MCSVLKMPLCVWVSATFPNCLNISEVNLKARSPLSPEGVGRQMNKSCCDWGWLESDQSLSRWCMPIIPVARRQGDQKVKASLGNLMRFYLKIKFKKGV